VYQCALVKKTNATAASAIKPESTQRRQRLQKRENRRRGPGSSKPRTNERTNAGERARTPLLLRSFLSYDRTRGRSRARAPAPARVSSNRRTNARARAIAAAAMVLSNGLRCEPRRIRQTPTVSQSVREPVLLPNSGLSFGPQLSILLGGVHVQ
jgi:hypothetical protein